MAQINLLPWRDERRQEQKKEFLTILAVVFVVAVGLVLLADRYVNGQIEYQQSRNNYLTQNIRELDKKIAEIKELQRRRNQLLDRMRVIQELQGNRPIIVRILDQLVRTVPDGVFYTSLQTKDKTISISGVAESNNRVSSLMRRLDASDWLADPNLDRVNAAAQYGDQATTFNLTVKVQLPKAEEESGG
ncbi:PilN domain-containing protein [Parahaliea maris]|uniref:PilN domain-containing protein n=1 Tax=Parahaliea maris TaxID=2716870 RepID=A0A5C9A2C2_9GAMM|nr:PilN domain-containing protein [Parahaliea maris]TXS93920.1 PilN domain-containing protein [Parahaliea maris]